MWRAIVFRTDAPACIPEANRRKLGTPPEEPALSKKPKSASPEKAATPPAEEEFPGFDVVVDRVHVDLDADELPPEILDRTLSSGGFPYDTKLKGKDYDETLETLQIELLKLQTHMHATGQKMVIVFEGRDSAGKGGTIKRFTEHLNPRSAHVVALAKPTEAESGQFYFQRYIAHLPTSGEIVFFDRSWYNRAVVEPVMGFCTPQQTEQFLKDVPVFEKMLVDNGIHLVKFWLTIGREMQIKRLFERRHDPLKRWKLSAIDYKGLPLWDSYTDAAERMLKETHTKSAPWTILRSNDQKRARIEAIRAVLFSLDYAGKDAEAVGKPDPEIVSDAALFRSRDGQI
jgi:polyphosphate kinase